MLVFVLTLLAGVVAAGFGGEWFVRGAVALAKSLRIPAGIIGATVAAFATSSPEFSVAVNAGLAGTPQIALGDALGSNVVNVALILGIALCISGIQAPRDSVRLDLPVAIAAPILTALLLLDGSISRFDGAIILLVFATWLGIVVRLALKSRATVDADIREDALPMGKTVLVLAAGLAALVVAGKCIVYGAKGIAAVYGWDEFLVGATLVALGTSAPELATVIIAKMRGHDDVGLGAVLGSNIFNGLWIVGVTALISPIAVSPREVFVGLAFGIATVMIVFPPKSGWITRRRGVVLLTMYVGYVVAILW